QRRREPAVHERRGRPPGARDRLRQRGRRRGAVLLRHVLDRDRQRAGDQSRDGVREHRQPWIALPLLRADRSAVPVRIVQPRTVIPGTVAGRSMLLHPAVRPYTVGPRTQGAPARDAQRWYFRASTPAEVSPDFNASWVASPQFARRLLGATPDAPNTIEVPNVSSWTSGQNCIERQYVGPMLRGGVSFAGATVSCVLKPRELDSTDNVTARIGVRIVSADGLTVRAVLLAVGDYGTGLEVDVHPGATTRIAANAQALASYVTQ